VCSGAVFHNNQVLNVFVSQVAEREAIRLERHKERERQHRIAAAAPGKRDKLLVCLCVHERMTIACSAFLHAFAEKRRPRCERACCAGPSPTKYAAVIVSSSHWFIEFNTV
jgi:hypothetical protein